MAQVIRSAVDSLDFAVKGRLSRATIDRLEVTREAAARAKKDMPVQLGAHGAQMLVKPSGTRSGYRYVASDGEDGASYCFRANDDRNGWNAFVSVRALCLLRRGYDGSKAYVSERLQDIGFIIEDHSINRIDFAVDLIAEDFLLDIENIVCPSRSTRRLYWSPERELDDKGSHVDQNAKHLQAIMRGRDFESITIGKLPGRQVIIYNKTAAARALKQNYWFDVFGVNAATKVWRTEIRAGRDALAKHILKRSFEAVEEFIPKFIQQAVEDHRIVCDAKSATNISRAPVDPLWQAVQRRAADIKLTDATATLSSTAIAEIRNQRERNALTNGFGNLLNGLILSGCSPKDIAEQLPSLASGEAFRYLNHVGKDALKRKAEEIAARLSILVPNIDPHDEKVSNNEAI